MADCSNTEVFLSEWLRMCYCTECKQCEFGELEDVYLLPCDVIAKEHPKKVIDIVQKWSDEHPAPKPKTYRDVFFEKFPNAMTRPATCIPRACRGNIFGAHSVEPNKCDKDGFSCIDCWNEPYKEGCESDG